MNLNPEDTFRDTCCDDLFKQEACCVAVLTISVCLILETSPTYVWNQKN